MEIALLTSKDDYQKNQDDLLVLRNLNEREGVDAYHCIWNDPSVQWDEFDKIVIRTPWDYSSNIENFLQFINNSKIKPKLINPGEIVNCNINKTYLKALESKGIPVIETKYISDWNLERIIESVQSFNIEKVILKPSISAGGRTVFLLNEKDHASIKTILERIPKIGELMIQPFKEEVKNGEYSTIVIGDKLFHTMIKKPSNTGYKVQSHFGGTEMLYTETSFHKDFCHKVLNSINGKFYYGRIDYILKNGMPELMELEFVEPDLFLRENGTALIAFCDLIAET